MRRHNGMISAEDLDRIVATCFERGWFVSREEAHALWTKHSKTMSAQCLDLPLDDDELFQIMTRMLWETP